MFEEPDAWEAGFRAGIAFAIGPSADLQAALAANPYRPMPEPEPEPRTPPPDPLPTVLEPGWKILFDDGMDEDREPIPHQATLDLPHLMYRWQIGKEHYGCDAQYVDWLAYHLPEDQAWLEAAMQTLTSAKVWVKPMTDGWHLVEGGKLVTLFVSYTWGRRHSIEELRDVLTKHNWPLN